MKIIGHRGAAGLALENTLESLDAGIKAGADAVEFDTWLTKDGHLVLSHDVHTGRVSSTGLSIPHTDFKKLREIKLHNGERIVTFKEAMKTAGKTPVVIDAKGKDWAHPLAEALGDTGHASKVTVIALNHPELFEFSKLRPDLPTYALDFWSPFKAMQAARQWKFTGIDISFWLLNPLTYWLARWHNLKVIVFTVDHVWLAKFLRFLYPGIDITTNRPDKLQVLR